MTAKRSSESLRAPIKLAFDNAPHTPPQPKGCVMKVCSRIRTILGVACGTTHLSSATLAFAALLAAPDMAFAKESLGCGDAEGVLGGGGTATIAAPPWTVHAIENGAALARSRGAAHVVMRRDGLVETYRPAPGDPVGIGRERRRAS